MCIFLHIFNCSRPYETAGKLVYLLFLSSSKNPKVEFGRYLFPDINSVLEGALQHLATNILNTGSNKAHYIYMIIQLQRSWRLPISIFMTCFVKTMNLY